MPAYEVICGNIGTSYAGNSYLRAISAYGAHKEQSEKGIGRAAGEDVTLLKDGEIKFEHVGSNPRTSGIND